MGFRWAEYRRAGQNPSDDPRCTMCGLDNRNDAHGALERTGYLGHTFTVKPRDPENTPSRVQLAEIRHRQEPSVDTAILGAPSVAPDD